MKAYAAKYPTESSELQRSVLQDFVVNIENLPKFDFGGQVSTRAASGKVLDQLSKDYPCIMGGSADLTGSTMAKGADGHFSKENRLGRNINYGVREHAMGAITNGLTLHGGLKAFSGAFFVFSDYMKPSLRLAAIMRIPSIFVFSHDSVAVGEDGPTHQPVEQLAGLRAIPGLNVIRPADANETAQAWALAVNCKHTPTAIITTRQNVRTLRDTPHPHFNKGAYVISKEQGQLHGIILASGSEVSLAVDVQQSLKEKQIYVRVVSMPSMYLFDKEKQAYKDEVLPKGSRILAVEMASSMPWYKYTSNVYGIDSFGVSAPIAVAIKHFGFTKEKSRRSIFKYKIRRFISPFF